jgi:hypothetical protein
MTAAAQTPLTSPGNTAPTMTRSRYTIGLVPSADKYDGGPDRTTTLTTPGHQDRIPTSKAGPTVRSWPLLVLALPASVAVWSGWVGIGPMTGFGQVHPLPGIWGSFHLNTAVTLPIGVEAYAAYALRAWLSPSNKVSAQTRQFARWSAIGSLLLGMAGQIAHHLLAQAHVSRALWGITTAVSCLPVLVLGMGAALAHLLHKDAQYRDHLRPSETARQDRLWRPWPAPGVASRDEPSRAVRPGSEYGSLRWSVRRPGWAHRFRARVRPSGARRLPPGRSADERQHDHGDPVGPVGVGQAGDQDGARGTWQIRRKPVLAGLINEYARAA